MFPRGKRRDGRCSPPVERLYSGRSRGVPRSMELSTAVRRNWSGQRRPRRRCSTLDGHHRTRLLSSLEHPDSTKRRTFSTPSPNYKQLMRRNSFALARRRSSECRRPSRPAVRSSTSKAGRYSRPRRFKTTTPRARINPASGGAARTTIAMVTASATRSSRFRTSNWNC